MTDADYWHHSIEAWKVRDRITRIADPAHWAIDYERHLQRDHAADLFRRIRPDAAVRYPDDAEDAGPGAERIGTGTSAFVVADAEGNMIAADADAEHVGRIVLRVTRSRFPLQQPPALEPHGAGHVRSPAAR